MNSKYSKIKIIIILSILLPVLIFSLVWFYAFKSRQLILNNKIATLNFNLNYFNDLNYLNNILEKVESNTSILERYIKNTVDIAKLKKRGYVPAYYNSLSSVLLTNLEETGYSQGAWFQADPYFLNSNNLQTHSVWLIRKNGKCFRNYNPPRKLTRKLDPWYFVPVGEKKPVWSSIYTDHDLSIPMITYSVPVYKDNTFIGVVGTDVSLSCLSKLLKEIKFKHKNADILILDNNKNIIASTLKPDSFFYYNQKDLYVYDSENFKIFVNNLNKNKDGFLSIKQNGIDKLAFSERLPNKFSYIFVMPESELLRGYNSYLLYILAVSSVLTVAIILILTRLITDLLNPYQSKEKRLAYIMDNSWNEISIVDANTLKIIYLNNAALKNLGYTLAEIRNADISIISQNLREDLESGFLKPLISGEKKSLFINANRIRKNGTIYPIEAHIQYFKDENPPIFVTLAKDISEQENMQKLQNQFISMVSHELRTPLTSIRGSLSLLAAGMFGQMPDEAKNMLTIAHNSSIRLVNLINDILDFEKISAGKMEFKFESTELMPILEQAIIANQPYAQQYNVSFDITKNLPGIKVNIDSDRFIQVITNLLSNAAKYSEENRSVEIAAFKHNDMIRVSVTNYGSEISEEYKSRIFQQFSQADSAETRKKGGTGLGLSICKLIMEKLSGSIGFDSANTITTFFIELPEYSENN